MSPNNNQTISPSPPRVRTKTKAIYLNWDTLEREGIRLSPSEAIVYFTLAFLCKPKGFWEGTYTELAEECRMGLDTTIRVFRKLREKELIISQNATTFSQNERNQKDKEKKQKKKKIEIKEKSSIILLNEQENENNNNFLETNNFISMNSNETKIEPSYYLKAIQKGFLQPRQIVEDFFRYNNARGWGSGDREAMFELWLQHEPTRNNGRRPILNEDERTYLLALCQNIPAVGVVPFLDMVVDFHLEPTLAKFDMHCTPERLQKLDDWLCAHLQPPFRQLYPSTRIAYRLLASPPNPNK